ncbi:TolC family protein [Fulvivirga lutimaris]|uniref:TolC family protein n=1 Tax=Fulvivirga lutimaris TaxID=1819566 RepID=UPI0012BBB0F3|nr:TolC family protein [Fulvivirga lutimaris]MTI39510.1 TolC family protein [Fulvivirga lutimaris]
MKYLKLLIFILLGSSTAYAQETVEWTLQECVEYALANNLTVKRSELNLKSSEVSLKQSKYNMLPSVNASGSYGYSWGRSIDPTTNQFVDNQRIASSNANINASVTLFNGFRIQNNIKSSEFAQESNELYLEDSKNNVTFNVISFYTNVLFTKELFENAKKQLESTEQQVKLTESRVNAGALPRASLLDLLAQKATNELNVVNRENDYLNAKIQLKQALQLPPENQIDIVVPELEAEIVPLVDVTAIEIYNIALNEQPNIQAAKFNTMSADYAVKSQRGNLYPTLSLNAGMNTRYSDAAQQPVAFENVTIPDPNGSGNDVQVLNTLVYLNNGAPDFFITPAQSPTDFETIGLSTQIDNNLGKYITLNLNIPIFNGFSARNNIQRSVITNQQAEITETETKYQLWQTIEQAYNNVQAAAKSYNASLTQVEAREESYRVTKQRYDNGAANFTDYQIAENDLFQAKSDLLRAKYDYIFKLKVLDFYQGKPLDF